MDWPLLAVAKAVEELAAGMKELVDDVREHAYDYLSAISRLFAISAELRGLERKLPKPKYRAALATVAPEMELLCDSVGATVDTLSVEFLGLTSPNVRRNWEGLVRICVDEGVSLPSRLELYQELAVGLNDVLKHDRDPDELEPITKPLRRLRARQVPLKEEDPIVRIISDSPPPQHPHPPRHGRPRPDDPIVSIISDSPAPQQPPPPPRFNPRPRSPRFGPAPPAPPPPPPPQPFEDPKYLYAEEWESEGYAYSESAVPMSPPVSDASWGEFPSWPRSVKVEASTSSTPQHWAMDVYDGRHPLSPFRGSLGQPTRCFGRDMPDAVDRLCAEGFIKVVEHPFEASEVFVRLYWRESDNRARILFLTKDPSGARHRYCFPLTALKIMRVGASLQFCRVNKNDGGLDLWAVLRFASSERMVLFYCTCVALKYQDPVEFDLGQDDFFAPPGEEQLFGGEIKDDGLLHALRIFRDTNSGSVRFEVTTRHGRSKKTPIWTAFVSDLLRMRGWLHRVDSRTVAFSELHTYVFCNNFVPLRGRSGRPEVRFTSTSDCDDFLFVIGDLLRL
ncbi:hypothetical protein JOL62DRAFT_591419 [Phyllosticta paracitricarpa]|uniref:Uncharacterized protein n=1 Tax=Phyllosticta paracitricarpa TaxID=2016321 RepID=A0ABR1NCA0_9PEZI